MLQVGRHPWRQRQRQQHQHQRQQQHDVGVVGLTREPVVAVQARAPWPRTRTPRRPGFPRPRRRCRAASRWTWPAPGPPARRPSTPASTETALPPRRVCPPQAGWRGRSAGAVRCVTRRSWRSQGCHGHPVQWIVAWRHHGVCWSRIGRSSWQTWVTARCWGPGVAVGCPRTPRIAATSNRCRQRSCRRHHQRAAPPLPCPQLGWTPRSTHPPILHR